MNIDDRKINVDHEDHDGLNCRRSNLRVATGTQNNGNRRKLILNTASRFKGVWKGKAKWRAVLALEKKMVYLGAHFIEEDAARAYDRAAIEYFGEFACINFPEEHLEFPYSHA
jgi:hypothetical protein